MDIDRKPPGSETPSPRLKPEPVCPGKLAQKPAQQLVQLGADGHAWTLAGVSLVLAFAAVWGSEWLMRRRKC